MKTPHTRIFEFVLLSTPLSKKKTIKVKIFRLDNWNLDLIRLK